MWESLSMGGKLCLIEPVTSSASKSTVLYCIWTGHFICLKITAKLYSHKMGLVKQRMFPRVSWLCIFLEISLYQVFLLRVITIVFTILTLCHSNIPLYDASESTYIQYTTIFKSLESVRSCFWKKSLILRGCHYLIKNTVNSYIMK